MSSFSDLQEEKLVNLTIVMGENSTELFDEICLHS